MQIICPHCRKTLVIPIIFQRYYGQPVQCQACRRAFSVPQITLSDQYSAVTDADSDKSSNIVMRTSLDRSVSGRLTHHAMRCTSCHSRLLVPGREQHRQTIKMTCPVCNTPVRYQGRDSGAHAGGIVIALTGGIGMGAVILWLDRQGHIALENMSGLIWMKMVATSLRDWVAKIELAMTGLGL